MKQKHNILAPILLAPVFLAFSARGENPTFAPEEGTVLSKSVRNAYEITLDDMVMIMNGQEMDAGMMGIEMNSSTSQTVTVTDEYVGVSGDRSTELERTFDELTSTTSVSTANAMTGDMDVEMPGTSDLEGLTVAFTWDDDAGEYTVEFADDSDGDPELLEGLVQDLDFSGLLPGSEVSEGDAWEIEAAALRAAFVPGGVVGIQPENMEDMMGMSAPQFSQDQMLGDLEGEVSGEFQGTRDEDGTRVAVILLEADVSSARDLTELMEEMMSQMELPDGMDFEMEVESFDMEFMFEGEGELLWNLESGLIYSLELNGEVNQTIDMAMNMNVMGQEQQVEQSMSLSGNHTVSVTTED